MNAKVGSQETPGVTGKFGHGVQNEAGSRLTQSFVKRVPWSEQMPPSTTQKMTLHIDIIIWSILKSN